MPIIKYFLCSLCLLLAACASRQVSPAIPARSAPTVIVPLAADTPPVPPTPESLPHTETEVEEIRLRLAAARQRERWDEIDRLREAEVLSKAKGKAAKAQAAMDAEAERKAIRTEISGMEECIRRNQRAIENQQEIGRVSGFVDKSVLYFAGAEIVSCRKKLNYLRQQTFPEPAKADNRTNAALNACIQSKSKQGSYSSRDGGRSALSLMEFCDVETWAWAEQCRASEGSSDTCTLKLTNLIQAILKSQGK